MHAHCLEAAMAFPFCWLSRILPDGYYPSTFRPHPNPQARAILCVDAFHLYRDSPTQMRLTFYNPDVINVHIRLKLTVYLFSRHKHYKRSDNAESITRLQLHSFIHFFFHSSHLHLTNKPYTSSCKYKQYFWDDNVWTFLLCLEKFSKIV